MTAHHASAEFAAWADALDADAAQSTPAGGDLWHGRLPSDDCDELNPSICARVAIREPSRGGDPVGFGLPGVRL